MVTPVRIFAQFCVARLLLLQEMMAERGVAADHTTIWRWIQHYAPRLEKEIRWYQGCTSGFWRVDETCIRVNGEWKSAVSPRIRTTM
jgi:transposase-like protein